MVLWDIVLESQYQYVYFLGQNGNAGELEPLVIGFDIF